MRFKVPANVDMADRIFAGLTARQLAILCGHALVLWALWAALGKSVPPIVLGAVAVPIASVGLVWATTTPEGTTLERLAAGALRHFLKPRRFVLAPEGLSDTSARGIAPIELPFGRVSGDGHIELTSGGVSSACRATSLNFALRSETEQRALIDGFGRLLNSLDGPVQFLVRADRSDLRALLRDIETRADQLPHPALQRAARDHAEFLRSLCERRDVLSRRVLVCLREPGSAEDLENTTRLDYRIEEASALLRGLGIRMTRLDGSEVAGLLARASDPGSAKAGSERVDGDGIVRGML